MINGLTHLTYHLDGTFWGNPTAGVREYQQEIMEGPYIASFVLEEGVGNVEESGLRAWFNNRLMTEFATTYEGTEVWRGFIWEMTLEMNGEIRVKSMHDMANATKCKYTNSSGDPVHTSWFTNDESIDTYGQKEKIVTISGEKLEEAEERAEVELQYHASPFTTAIAYRDTDRNTLSVQVAGRMVAANNTQLMTDTMRYFEQLDDVDNALYPFSGSDPTGSVGDEITVSNEILRLCKVSKDNGRWLYPLDFDANDTLTAVGVSTNVGLFDRMLELSKLRNSDGEFYKLQVRHNGGVIYKKATEDVDYLNYQMPRGLEMPGGDVPMWGAKPGIIKTVDISRSLGMPDTRFNDKRLNEYERTVMRDGDKQATFHGRELDAADIYRAQEANQRWIEAANK